MISFIIIGKNEGWRLNKCLQSIFETIEYNKIENAEVIYVDSKSSDDSIERAKVFKNLRIFLITGECNAAIARNIGANEAIGNILYFVDGDMELNNEFLKHAFENNKLKYDCVTGHVDDYLYDRKDIFWGKKTRTYVDFIPKNEQNLKTNGGIFIIMKDTWNAVGGMRTKYKRSQDIDFSFKLLKKGYTIIRLPYLITKHHTIEYSNEYRFWNDLYKGNFKFAPIIFRDYITTTFAWKRLLRSYYSESILLFAIVSSLTLGFFTNPIWLLYSLVITFRSINYTLKSQIKISRFSYFFQRTIFQVLIDFLFWISFFFIFPKNPDSKYIQVNIVNK